MALLKHGFIADDIIKEGRITETEIAIVRTKLRGCKVPELTDEQILLFILSCDRDLDFTIVTIQQYYKARRNAPELFDNRDLTRPELAYQLGIIEYSVFPNRTPDGCAVLFHRLHDTYFSHYHMEHSMKLLFMTLDQAVYDHPPTGLVIVFDMRGVGLWHLTRVRLGALRKFAHYLQEGLPVKLKQMHVLNTILMDKILLIAKPLLKPELFEQIQFHPCDMNMDEFFEKYLPKSCMPSDFGGDLFNTRILHAENTKKLESMKEYFATEEKQRHDYYKK